MDQGVDVRGEGGELSQDVQEKIMIPPNCKGPGCCRINHRGIRININGIATEQCCRDIAAVTESTFLSYPPIPCW